MSEGILPAFAPAFGSTQHSTRSRYEEDEMPVLNFNEDEKTIFITALTRKRVRLLKEWTRSAADMRVPNYSPGTSSTRIIATEIVNAAINDAKPIIEKNLKLVEAIRAPLETSTFGGRASIVELVKGQQPSAFDIRLDRKQAERFNADRQDATFPLAWNEYLRALVGI